MTRGNPRFAHPDEFTMSFGDHLEELRRRIILAALFPLPISLLTFLFSDTLIRLLVVPLRRALEAEDLPVRLQVLSPPEVLLTKIKLSIISALILSAPWVLWQFWLFVRPGLFGHERRFVYFLIPGSAILTAAGVAFMYFLMLPLVLLVLIGVGTSMSLGQPDSDVTRLLATNPQVQIVANMPEQPEVGTLWLLVPEMTTYAAVDAGEGNPADVRMLQALDRGIIANEFRLATYISFVLVLFLAIVIAFQMPLVVVLLGWMGLASPEWLGQRRKYALLVCGVVAAVITPADVVSMIAMLIPLYLLYELGILLLRVAPASKVAAGGVFTPKLRRSDHPGADKPDRPSQSSQADPREDDDPAQQQDSDDSPDGRGDAS